MNITNHTRGPWSIETPCEGLSIVEANKEPSEWRFIAQVPTDAENGIPINEAEANAELIRQAPELWSALADCYMMAKRQAARLRHEGSKDGKTIEAWNNVIRFCEKSGQKSNLLRETVPTDITGG